ncbi:Uncharacterised protein [Escherichia coli]|uniref:Uncharacterized protein n=1 Tax=Escherichia coli TaxID=562 RepID=A0A376P2U8_ECOLX|nr:Uncharacterised protein [Escherichia coli]
MPVHQLNGLTCQRPFYMGHKFVEIQDVLRTGFTEINPPLFAVLQIIKKTLAGQTDKFTSDNFSCNNTFGVADPVSTFAISLSLLKVLPADQHHPVRRYLLSPGLPVTYQILQASPGSASKHPLSSQQPGVP